MRLLVRQQILAVLLVEQIEAPLVGERLAPLELRGVAEQRAHVAAQIAALGGDEARLARGDARDQRGDILRSEKNPELPSGH